MAVNSFREDEQVVSQGKWKVIVRLLAYLKNYKLGVAGVLLCMMATVAISLVNPLIIEAAIDNYIDTSKCRYDRSSKTWFVCGGIKYHIYYFSKGANV